MQVMRYPMPGTIQDPGSGAWDRMYDAIAAELPREVPAGDLESLATFATRRGLAPSDATQAVRSVWSQAPSSFTLQDHVVVMGAALIGGVTSSGPGYVIDAIWRETPSSFDSALESAVMAVAVLSRLDPDHAAEIVAGVWRDAPREQSLEETASQMQAGLIGAGYNASAREQYADLIGAFA